MAQRPRTQAQRFASTLSQRYSCVQTSPGARGCACAAATHDVAWHGVAGKQSASTLHGSSDSTGAHRAQPQSLGPGRGAALLDAGADEAHGAADGALEHVPWALSLGAGAADALAAGRVTGCGEAAAPPPQPRRTRDKSALCMGPL